MDTQIEIFFGSLASTSGGIFKGIQTVQIDIPTLEEAKEEVNKFLSRDDIEIISVSHQYNDGLLSILVHYKPKPK